MALSSVVNFFQDINVKIANRLNTPNMQECKAKASTVGASIITWVKDPKIKLITKVGVAALVLLGLYLAYTFISYIIKATIIVGCCVGIYKLYQKYAPKNPPTQSPITRHLI